MNSTVLRNISAVSKNTFKETIRNKILYAILAFSIIYMALTTFLGTISLGEDMHVVRSLGLAGIYVFGLIITVFLGSSLLHREIEGKALYFTLSKPVSRAHLILGKFFGLFASVAVSTGCMAVVYVCAVAFEGGGFDVSGLLAILYQLLEMALLIALTVFFSTFSTPLVSAIYAVLMIYIGHSLDLLVSAVTHASLGVRWLALSVSYVLPNLEKFNIRDLALYDAPVSFASSAYVVLYAFAYIALLLCAAVFLFEHREL